jgi:hypothetical protein
VIAGSNKLLVTIGDRYPQLIRAHDRLAQNIATQSMEATRSSVHYHQSLRGKSAGDKLRKSLAQTLAFPIAGGELIEHWPGPEDFTRLGHQILNILSQGHAAGRHSMRVPGTETQSLQLMAVGQRYVIRFCKVMIFGRQPENRHMRAAGGGCVFCFANRGRRFEDGKERAAEQRNLLAADHCAGAVPQPRDV